MVWLFIALFMYLAYCSYLGISAGEREQDQFSPPVLITFVLLLITSGMLLAACFRFVTMLDSDELRMLTIYRAERQQEKLEKELIELKGVSNVGKDNGKVAL